MKPVTLLVSAKTTAGWQWCCHSLVSAKTSAEWQLYVYFVSFGVGPVRNSIVVQTRTFFHFLSVPSLILTIAWPSLVAVCRSAEKSSGGNRVPRQAATT